MENILSTIAAGFYTSVIAAFSGLTFIMLEVFISMIGGAINENLFGMDIDEFSIWHTVSGNIFVLLLLVIWYFLGTLVI